MIHVIRKPVRSQASGQPAERARRPAPGSGTPFLVTLLALTWTLVFAQAAPATAPGQTNHWAFRRPARPVLPAVHDRHWARNEIDYFVLAQLEKEHLRPAPEADRATLIRRLSLDLTGLPPTLREIDAFLADKSPEAYPRLVDRLLASPHYGECWGRHWLDAARYADTNGYEKDLPRNIWPYRNAFRK